jgi:hypothetical protein
MELAALMARLRNTSLCAFKDRYYGEASTFIFLQRALEEKGQLSGVKNHIDIKLNRPEYWTVRPVSHRFSPFYVTDPQLNPLLYIVGNPAFKTRATGLHISR